MTGQVPPQGGPQQPAVSDSQPDRYTGYRAQYQDAKSEAKSLREAVESLTALLNLPSLADAPLAAGDMASDLYSEQKRRLVRKLVDVREAAGSWQPPPVAGSLAAELAHPRETHQYRISGLAGWNHNVVFAGARKTGKTQFSVNLTAALSMSALAYDWPALAAYCAGTGMPPADPLRLGRFLGVSDCFMAGNVAYVNAEMDPDDWRDCFRALPAGSYDASRIHPLHCRGVPLPVITSPAARAWFISWLRERDTEVLIIDTWGAFCAKNGVRSFNDDAEARVITDGLDEIKAAAGVASVIVLIHTPHQTGEKHLERFKGAGSVGDWADVLWTYVADADGIRYLSALGRARIDRAESSLYFDQASGLLSWGATGSREQTAGGRARQRILAALEAAGPDGMLTEELVTAAGGHVPDARKAIAKLAADGEVEVERRGNAKIHRLPQEHPHPTADPAGE